MRQLWVGGLLAVGLITAPAMADEESDLGRPVAGVDGNTYGAVEFAYDEVTNVGAVILRVGVLDCPAAPYSSVGYGTRGKPELATKPNKVVGLNMSFDSSAMHASGRSPQRFRSIPILVDNVRKSWPVIEQNIELEACTSDGDCRWDVRTYAKVSADDLRLIAKSKRAVIRFTPDDDCELSAADKAYIANFLRDAPAIRKRAAAK